MSQDWDIKARDDACARCEQPFSDGAVFSSLLTYGEDGYSREDICEACWADVDKQGTLSSWKGVYKVPPPAPEEPLKKETAESLLRELMEVEDPTKINVMYILAVMLERRRIFAERDVQEREDGMKIRVYEHKKTGETFLIPDPELKLAEIHHVQEEVVVMLGGKVPGSEKAEDVEIEQDAKQEEEIASDG